MTGRLLRAAPLALAGALLAGCVVYDSGPSGPDGTGGRPFVEGRWRIDARVVSSSCGFVDDEPFSVRVFQNGDLLQLVLTVGGFGDVRYDGRLDRDGDFFARQSTLYAEDGLHDASLVEGRFGAGGRTMIADEVEDITDLVTGRTCRIVWRWRGDRA